MCCLHLQTREIFERGHHISVYIFPLIWRNIPFDSHQTPIIIIIIIK